MRNLVRKTISFLSQEKNTRAFKAVAKTFRTFNPTSNGIILVESRHWATCQISLLCFLPAALEHYNSSLVIYDMEPRENLHKLRRAIKNRVSVVRSISHYKTLNIVGQQRISNTHKYIFDQFVSGSVEPRTLESFTYRGVLIGDLVYDTFLRKKNEPTIDFQSESFKFTFLSFLQYCDQLIDYFEKNTVKAVVLSHTTYKYGIPARIALIHDIDVFHVDLNFVGRATALSSNPYFSLLNVSNEVFLESDQDTRKIARDLGRKLLDEALSDRPIENNLSTNVEDHSSSKLSLTKLIGHKPFVLIAIHDFYDACHVYGNNFHSDFYLWLDDIGQLTKNSGYLFLLKPHPSAVSDAGDVLAELSDKYPQFIVISKDISHHDLVEMGLSVCLTVYGSVAHELPKLGVKVINASRNNPHVNFNFSFTPKTLQEYRNILLNIEKFTYEPDLNSLYEYYFLRFVYNLQSWVIPEYKEFLNALGGIREPDREKTFYSFLNLEKKVDLHCLKATVLSFLKSHDLILGRKHFPPNCLSETRNCQCRNIINFMEK